MKSNKALVVDFALTDREEDEPEEGELPEEGEQATVLAEDTEEGLSANASKVQELADTLASEIEAENIASPEDNDDEGDNT